MRSGTSRTRAGIARTPSAMVAKTFHMPRFYQLSWRPMTEAKDDDGPEANALGTSRAPISRDDRAPITLRVEYKRINTFFADYTKNISRGGTFIRTPRPLDIGTEFMFVLSLPESVQVELKGIVKWAISEAEATDEKPAGMGIQFVFATDAERHAVESVVEGMMNEALGPILAGKLLRGSGSGSGSGSGPASGSNGA